MAVTWNYENAAHLLRRAAFGGAPEEITAFRDRHANVVDAVGELLGFPPSRRKPPAPNKNDRERRLKMQRWWIKRMVNAKTPADACREKLALFWHGHLVSGGSKQPALKYMSYQNRLFREYARGNFRALVREFARDPANLYYLDGIYNYASNDGVHVNANENFGRELMELFTLGVSQLQADGTADPSKPNYTEDDVHNMARACTGWTSIVKDQGVWNQSDWDGGDYDDDGDDLPDPMTIFGQSSNNFRIDEGVAGTADDVLELVFSRLDDEGNNQTAMFIAKKLWAWYAYPAPEPGLKALLASFASAFTAADFEVTPMLQAMWTHDEFYSDRAKTGTVKSPCDYVVQAMRAFGIARSNAKYIGEGDLEVPQHLEEMGMVLFEPPNVAGWPGGGAWINSATLLARLNFAKELAATDWGRNKLDLTRIPGLIGNPSADPEDVVAAIVYQLGLDIGPVPLTFAQQNALLAFATNNGAKSTLDLSDEWTDDATKKVRGLISLALQCAENQIF